MAEDYTKKLAAVWGNAVVVLSFFCFFSFLLVLLLLLYKDSNGAAVYSYLALI